MENKKVKFRDHLAAMILSREKTSTWRLFDDKDLKVGDIIDLINWNTTEKFGEAEILEVLEKPLSELEDSDFMGHEKFESTEQMYEIYKKYYGDRVTPETVVKIIRFKLL